MFYSGYYAEAAPFVQQLRDGGFTGTFASADGTKRIPGLVKQAGQSAKDAIPVLPVQPGHRRLRQNYKELFGQDAGTYSPLEGCDLGTIMLQRASTPGKITRADLLDFVPQLPGQGVARHYQWTDTGELTGRHGLDLQGSVTTYA